MFLHAYLKPKRELKDSEKGDKEKTIDILKNIENGEEVITSVVHISEILNIIEARLGLDKTIIFLEDLLSMENIKIEKRRKRIMKKH
ncbi:MAG: PIN domain-containing protein [Thermoproteota archaeon]|nr:PIN domain-containing protein [Thermoproteota archaeon]